MAKTSTKKSYEQRQAAKKSFMKVTVVVLGLTMLLGVVGSQGFSALMTAMNPPASNEQIYAPPADYYQNDSDGDAMADGNVVPAPQDDPEFD